MKKMKKLFAVLLAFAMVMGMSLTSFAEVNDDATITIRNAGEAASFEYAQVIEANERTVTGWDIVDDFLDEFVAANAFNITVPADATPAQKEAIEQTIIAGMIYDLDSSASKGDQIEGFDARYAKALNNLYETINDGNYTTTTDNPFEVSSAGVYVIVGTETGFSYSPMAAYVGFFEYVDGVPTAFENEVIEAKRVPTTVTKEAELKDNGVDNKDEVTEISREETYKISSTVPFIPLTDSDRTYFAKDSLTGGQYDVETDGTLAVRVIIGTEVNETLYATVTKDQTADHKYSFALDLTKYLANNQYANKNIELSYDVIVKDTVVNNDVIMGTANDEDMFGSDSEQLYTCSISITKYASDADNNNLEDNAKLAGAGFVVYKEADNVKSYATFDANNKFVDWVATEEAATIIYTAKTTGIASVSGLDLGTYFFKEVVAPEGYSLNEQPSSVTVVLPEGVSEAVATTTLAGTTTMIDTELSALPSTGGIGTAVFTIGGCAIMIVAAYFFFVSRKKEA